MPTKRVPTVDVGDGLRIPVWITETTESAGGYTVELTAAYAPDSGRYFAWKLLVRAPEGAEVTGEGLRAVPVAAILRQAVADNVGPLLAPGLGATPRRDLRKAGPTTETLTWVARVYRLALLLGDAPTQAVAAALDVPRSTAGRWVTRARDRGLLTVIDPRATARVEA